MYFTQMHISKFRVLNYKSFFDSGEIDLQPGINIITGQNNAGKTALIQALSLKFDSNLHRSSKSLPSVLSNPVGQSEINVEIDLSKEELETYIFDYMSQIKIHSRDGISYGHYSGKSFFDNYVKTNNTLSFTISHGSSIKSASFKFIQGLETNQTFLFGLNKKDKTFNYSGSTNLQNDSSLDIGTRLLSRIYAFNAERLNVGRSAFGTNSTLSTNASNLPEVLNILQSDKYRYARYVSLVKEIFPQVYDVSIRPSKEQDRTVEIVIWNEDPKHERSDLVVPLAESGTGIGQVLSILYVVLTTNTPNVIIIDEPNSFLHPGASRKLIEILKEHPQHQFIISTHSPSAIAAANPKTINIVRNKDAQSYIEAIDIEETNKQQLYLAEIGSKLSDVFGADSILWVEGKTEEICYPKIVEATKGVSLMGTTILGVKHTGDFQTKNAELVFDIYTKLSKGKGLIPPAIGFIFDSENQTEQEMEGLRKKSGGIIMFTGRMMYENYLINSNALLSVLNSYEIHGLTITLDTINSWLEQNKWNKQFIKSKYSKNKNPEDWLRYVHGAKLLSQLFSDLTQQRVTYDKIVHSVALTEWIIENSIEDIHEIQNLLGTFLKHNNYPVSLDLQSRFSS